MRSLGGSGGLLVAAVALLGCGASGAAKPGSGGSAGDGSAAPANAGASSSGAPGLTPGAPALPGQLGGVPSSPLEPPVTSDLPGFELPDFDGFDPGAASGSSAGCQQAQRSFVPQIPTVFILVDRSDSMFLPNPAAGGGNTWAPLRTGVLSVIEDLQSEVRFGFGAFSGQGSTCPDLPNTVVALDNYEAIASLYNSLDRSAYKDTPTLLAVSEVAEQLWADPTEGAKYILFVTDGEPDYCDDGTPVCPPDSVVGLLQRLALGIDGSGAQNEPIQTFVFGIDSPLSTISTDVLRAFANAGRGLPVAPLLADPNAMFDQCNGVNGWRADFNLTGKPFVRGQTIGDYAAIGGNAPVFRPDPNDQAELVGQIRAALAGVKSCTFDLAGDGVEVDIARPDLGALATVVVNGAAVPFDPVNGWHMLSPTTVELSGAACESWRVPGSTSIAFDFPCDLIIIQ